MMMGGDGGGGGGGGEGGGGDPMSGRLGMLMGQVEMAGPTTTHHHHHHQQQQGMSMGALGGRGGELIRLPQWGPQETRDLISVRAELERDLGGSAKRRSNKTLWEAVAAKMRERGHMRRTPEQCKCKWKNLVNRYKGKETADPDSGRQCPFFEELHAVFTERARNMQRLLQETEPGASQSRKKKRLSGDKSSDDFSEDDDEDDEDSDEERPTRSKKKKVVERGGQQQKAAEKSKMVNPSSIRDVLQDFFQQQQRMELQWHEMMERRAQERQRFEQEWRLSMEKLERERLMLEQAWREREEQRRMREESRAEKRDALLTTLLNKLIQEEGLQ